MAVPAIAAVAQIVAAAATTNAILAAIIEIGLSIGLSKLSQRLAGKPKYDKFGPPRDVTIRGTVQPRQLVYGQTKTPGYIAFYGVSGLPEAKYLWFVIVWAGHQCEAIQDHWIDAQLVPDTEINGSTGEVTTANFVNGTSKLFIWKHLGTHSQAVDANLAAAFGVPWTTTHKGSGIAYSVVRLEKDEKVYPSGAPNSIFGLVKGRRLYDPRKDSTNGGSGSHRYADATTWEWSTNAVLAQRDYISGGAIVYSLTNPDKRLAVGESDVRIDDAFVIAGANICDETPSIPPASPATTQRRYTCDVQLSCGDTHQENIAILLSATNGHLSYVGGKYRLYVGAYDSPAIALNEDDIQGNVEILTHPQGEDVYNLVSGTFFDEARMWEESSFPARTNSSYETDDGGQKPRPIQLPATRTSYRCQRIAEQILKQSRNKILVEFTHLSPKAMQIAVWETFSVSISEYGWVNKVLRCLRFRFLADGFVAITAGEESSAAYADPAVADYAAPGAAVSPPPEIESPSAPINFTSQGVRNGIQFAWQLPTVGRLNSTVELWEYTSVSPFSSATKIWEGFASGKFISKTDTTQRYYWIRLRADGQRVSATVPNGDGLPGKASVVDTALTASVLPGSATGSDDDLDGHATTNSVTVTPAGGIPPYTYAWTFAAGGTNIGANSPTSATTTWHDITANLTAGEVRTGTARCTVTDNASATYTVDVAVQISRPSASITSSVTPSSVSGFKLSNSPATVTSSTATCAGAPGGGTFSWRRVSGDSSITANNPTSAATKFSATVAPYSTVVTNFVCDYTQGGNTATSNEVQVTLICEGTS